MPSLSYSVDGRWSLNLRAKKRATKPSVEAVASADGHLQTTDHLEEAYALITALVDSLVKVKTDLVSTGDMERMVRRVREHIVHARDQRYMERLKGERYPRPKGSR